MSVKNWLSVVGIVAILSLAGACSKAKAPDATAQGGADQKTYQDVFNVDPKDLVTTGSNKYWPLEVGHRLYYEGKKGHNLTITVLNETKLVDGIETRVVEEREVEDGALAEISRNYFAADKTTGDLYYFGEDVDIYKDGKVTDHGGSWLSGVNGAKFGLMMPGTAKVGAKYYQERAPKVAQDHAEIVSLTEKIATPAGTFDNCLKTAETDMEGANSSKTYAPSIGLIIDGDLKLVEFGKAGKMAH